jgi:hypothetical protein
MSGYTAKFNVDPVVFTQRLFLKGHGTGNKATLINKTFFYYLLSDKPGRVIVIAELVSYLREKKGPNFWEIEIPDKTEKLSQNDKNAIQTMISELLTVRKERLEKKKEYKSNFWNINVSFQEISYRAPLFILIDGMDQSGDYNADTEDEIVMYDTSEGASKRKLAESIDSDEEQKLKKPCIEEQQETPRDVCALEQENKRLTTVIRVLETQRSQIIMEFSKSKRADSSLEQYELEGENKSLRLENSDQQEQIYVLMEQKKKFISILEERELEIDSLKQRLKHETSDKTKRTSKINGIIQELTQLEHAFSL